MKPTEAQIKEFWEWCGRKNVIFVDELCLHDDSNGHRTWLNLDLNSLFKYAVPKVYDMELYKVNRFEGEWQVAYRARVRLARKHWQDFITDKDPALALFWALDKVREISK